MATEQQRLDEFKERLATIKAHASKGLADPDNAALHLCEAFVLMADTVEYFVTEAEAEGALGE